MRDVIESAVSHLYEGDQEKAAEALDAAISLEVDRRVGKYSATDTRALKNEVKTEMAWEIALERFSADRQDIVGDATLLGVWQQELDVAAPKCGTPDEAIERASKHTDAWLSKIVSPNRERQNSEPPDPSDVIEQMKRDRGQVSGADQQSEETDVVFGMKRARGQL